MKTKLDRVMDFYADNFMLFFGGFFLMLPVVAVCLQACSDNRTPEEQAVLDAQLTEDLSTEVITFSPRDGVECYVIRGSNTMNPRMMSCVVLPPETK